MKQNLPVSYSLTIWNIAHSYRGLIWTTRIFKYQYSNTIFPYSMLDHVDQYHSTPTALSINSHTYGCNGILFINFNHVCMSFILFKYHHRGCLNNPTFSNLGQCAACWTHFMCHHELWPASLLLSQKLFSPCGRKTLPEIYYPYL